jgi:hypothetical protein
MRGVSRIEYRTPLRLHAICIRFESHQIVRKWISAIDSLRARQGETQYRLSEVSYLVVKASSYQFTMHINSISKFSK